MIIEITLQSNITLICTYFPPSSTDAHYNKLLSTIVSLSDNQDIIIVGDLNLPDINWSTLTGTSTFTSSLCNLLYNKNFIQLISGPTHKQGNTLDIILTNVPNRICNITILTHLPVSHCLTII